MRKIRGMAWDIMNCTLSLLSVTMYVIQSYYAKEHEPVHGPVAPKDAILMDKLDQVLLLPQYHHACLLFSAFVYGPRMNGEEEETDPRGIMCM